MSAELRPEWTCAKCRMRVYNPCHDAIPAPTGWDRMTDRCLACAKEGESAEDTEDRARRMVLEGKETNETARACKGVTKGRINDLRKELIESGDLDPALAPKRPKKPPKPSKPKPPPEPKAPDPARTAAEELMRNEPTMSNKEIGDLVGANFRVVGKWRRKAGIPSSEATRRAEAKALLAADPTLRNAEVKARMRHPVSSPVLRQVRSELGIAPPALN